MDANVGTSAGQLKKRTFKKFTYRGVDLEALLDMPTDELCEALPSSLHRGLRSKPMALIKKMRKAVNTIHSFTFHFFLLHNPV
ncbi:Ribosomal protein S19/S15 [Cynara cardunculus var. scolymus]|uniref:Ribosomal protein S19/S15 n=1 Tax=Cynara cardunculus var. scolymus TaxID=59895 RepID=A0A103XGS3_CYNCS|nr:Ribosomal protein S19/S15 [Cynara cardunculus var. scolymus]